MSSKGEQRIEAKVHHCFRPAPILPVGEGALAGNAAGLKTEAAYFSERGTTLLAAWLHDHARNRSEPLLNVGAPSLDRLGERLESEVTRLSYAA